MRGVPSSTISRAVDEGSEDKDLVISVSSEELIQEEDLCTEETEAPSGEAEDIDSFRSEFANLFLSPEKKVLGKVEVNNISHHLVPFIEGCDIKLI